MPLQLRAEYPVYVGWFHVDALSRRTLQASRSISSFAPATTTFGLLGSIATAGSFCLFRGNGELGLPTVTSVSGLKASAPGTTMTAPRTASAKIQTARLRVE